MDHDPLFAIPSASDGPLCTTSLAATSTHSQRNYLATHLKSLCDHFWIATHRLGTSAIKRGGGRGKRHFIRICCLHKALRQTHTHIQYNAFLNGGSGAPSSLRWWCLWKRKRDLNHQIWRIFWGWKRISFSVWWEERSLSEHLIFQTAKRRKEVS